MPKALLDFLGYKFFFWSNEDEERRMSMYVRESRLQMPPNFGSRVVGSDWSIIKARYHKMI